MESLYLYTSYPFPTKIDELDALVASIIKGLDLATVEIRDASSSFVSSILAAALGKGFSLADLLGLLSSNWTKTLSKEGMIGIAEIYATVLKRLDKVLEKEYFTFLKNMMDLVSYPKPSSTKRDYLFARAVCSELLSMIGKRISEPALPNALSMISQALEMCIDSQTEEDTKELKVKDKKADKVKRKYGDSALIV